MGKKWYNSNMKDDKPKDELNRAAQFLPFDALGIQRELSLREERRKKVEKKQLDEERLQHLNAQMQRLSVGTRASVVFYMRGRYLEVQGTVTRINLPLRHIVIGEQKLLFDDIYDIEILD